MFLYKMYYYFVIDILLNFQSYDDNEERYEIILQQVLLLQ